MARFFDALKAGCGSFFMRTFDGPSAAPLAQPKSCLIMLQNSVKNSSSATASPSVTSSSLVLVSASTSIKQMSSTNHRQIQLTKRSDPSKSMLLVKKRNARSLLLLLYLMLVTSFPSKLFSRENPNDH